MEKATVTELEIPAGHRILAVSDIHANPVFLRALLKKVAFESNDYLFLLGDLVEKGEESLATLRQVMALTAEYPHVYPLCGNCDDITITFMDRTQAGDWDFFESFFQIWGGKSLLLQMAAEAGFQVRGHQDYPALRQVLIARFGPELDFLRTLPTIIRTPDYLFVHGGVPQEEALEDLDAWRCMKNDDFLSQGHTFRRWCVVGHWPVTLYHPHIPCARPLIQRDRRIISIDGGCSLKLDGQLNALIIPHAGAEDFDYVSYDGLPLYRALEAQEASEDSVNIRWGKNLVECLSHGPELCRCRHLETGRKLDILTDYLYEQDGLLRCEDSTDYRLPVQAGDLLSVVRRTARGALVKRDGITGWYLGPLEPVEGEAR